MTRKRKLIAKPGPGYDGKVEHGTMIVVDPYDGTRLKAQGNVKHDILVHWLSRDQIDRAQFTAGCRLQAIWYRAQAGNVGTCIPVNTRVDTSGARDPIPLSMVTAQGDLAEVRHILGVADFRLVKRFVCEKQLFQDMDASAREREYTARRVRDALSELAEYWGMVAHGKRGLPIMAYRDTPAA